MDTKENTPENVVQRLRAKMDEARRLGFHVRLEVLEDQQASWCVLADVPTLFVDLSQTAAEQLRQVDEILVSYQSEPRNHAA